VRLPHSSVALITSSSPAASPQEKESSFEGIWYNQGEDHEVVKIQGIKVKGGREKIAGKIVEGKAKG